MPDPIFEHPRLVAIYDALDPDRSDLDVYAAIASELGARHVVDLGCGPARSRFSSPTAARR